MKTLETERLILRAWKETDSDDLYEYARTELVGPNAGWAPHKDEDESKKIIEMFIKNDDVYAIELKSEGKVIGGIGMHKTHLGENLGQLKQREIGYVLNPSYWGNGYVPEAVNFLIQYGFEELGLDVIWCGHFETNMKSKRVNEKCGFKYQLSRIQVLNLLDGREVNTLYYNITRERYFQERNSNG